MSATGYPTRRRNNSTPCWPGISTRSRHTGTERTAPDHGQVLGHRRRWLVHPGSQLIDRQFLIDQRPQQAHPGGVRQHPEHLNGELGLLDRQTIRPSTICAHTQIISQPTAVPKVQQRASQIRCGRWPFGSQPWRRVRALAPSRQPAVGAPAGHRRAEDLAGVFIVPARLAGGRTADFGGCARTGRRTSGRSRPGSPRHRNW